LEGVVGREECHRVIEEINKKPGLVKKPGVRKRDFIFIDLSDQMERGIAGMNDCLRLGWLMWPTPEPL